MTRAGSVSPLVCQYRYSASAQNAPPAGGGAGAFTGMSAAGAICVNATMERVEISASDKRNMSAPSLSLYVENRVSGYEPRANQATGGCTTNFGRVATGSQHFQSRIGERKCGASGMSAWVKSRHVQRLLCANSGH